MCIPYNRCVHSVYIYMYRISNTLRMTVRLNYSLLPHNMTFKCKHHIHKIFCNIKYIRDIQSFRK